MYVLLFSSSKKFIPWWSLCGWWKTSDENLTKTSYKPYLPNVLYPNMGNLNLDLVSENHKIHSSKIWTINLQLFSQTLYPLVKGASWYTKSGSDQCCHLEKFIRWGFFHQRFFITTSTIKPFIEELNISMVEKVCGQKVSVCLSG